MTAQPHSRRTLLPLALLLGGLLGVGPFVPRTFGAEAAPAAIAALDVPGLAAWLGIALAVAALAGIALSRRGQTTPAAPPDISSLHTEDTHEVDPLLAALRGAAAYAPDDLDTRLGARTSVGSASSAEGSPRWVRRIDPRQAEPASPEQDDPTGGWQAVTERDLLPL